MKGDFTRSAFNPKKHYSAVRLQQGRVQLDSDWNEQVDIAAHRVETETGDVLGRYGVPTKDEDSGFKITVTDGDPPEISKGRLYLDGILVENDKKVFITEQNEFLPGYSVNRKAGEYLVYLDVWQRHVTALEDDQIREVALGGPDTATRTQTVWQVRLSEPLAAPLTCASEPDEWNQIVGFTPGKLRAHTALGTTPTNLCEVPAGAGYRRLENQLYRVEIHLPGVRGTATFKWSRDNGSIVTAWTGQDGNNLIVKSIGRDQVLGFAAGQTVELTDDVRELYGDAEHLGVLVKLSNAEGQVLTLDPASPAVDRNAFGRNPKVRRWDSNGDVQTSVNWIPLEDGVEVCFEDANYKTGDYWMIPARTAKSDVEWPADETDPKKPAAVPRQGIEHHYCRLATLHCDGNKFTVTGDCRPIFPPLTMLTNLYYVSGDGQEAMPVQPLPHALRVRVANGQLPVIGAKIRFNILLGGGSLSTNAPVSTVAPDGTAECEWTLGTSGKQQVEARLLEAAETLDAAEPQVPGQVILFNANLSIASQVEYNPVRCTYLKDKKVNTVQEAIEELCIRERRGGCAVTVGNGGEHIFLDEALRSLLEEKKTDICICLLPGNHSLPENSEGINLTKDYGNVNIKITGCGPGTRISLQKPWIMKNVAAFTLRDVTIDFDGPQDIMMSLGSCPQVTLESCFITGITEDGFLLVIEKADQIRLNNNILEAFQPKSLRTFAGIFKKIVGNHEDIDFDNLFLQNNFYLVASRIVEELSKLDSTTRKTISDKITKAALSDDKLNNDEKESYANFASALSARTVNRRLLRVEIYNIRRIALIASPGNAVAIMDGDANVTLEDNDIRGVVSLYGLHVGAELNDDQLGTLGALIKSRAIGLIGSTGRLQMSKNRFTRLFVADNLINMINAIIDKKKGAIEGIFGDSFIDDNLIIGGRNQFISRRLFLNFNSFFPGDSTAGTAITDSAVFVGNQGAHDKILFNNVSRVSEKAANLSIHIRDLPPV